MYVSTDCCLKKPLVAAAEVAVLGHFLSPNPPASIVSSRRFQDFSGLLALLAAAAASF
jgi:hypothetical protein